MGYRAVAGNWVEAVEASPPVDAISGAIGVSAFIMTLNEEVNIGRCLDALRWCDDIVLLDSQSSDRTVEIAESYPNVRVRYRVFDDYSGQRNYGLRAIDYANPWLLIVDADEVVTPDLVDDIRSAMAMGDIDRFDVFLVQRTPFLDGRGLRRNYQSHFWIPRLVRPTAVRFEGIVHERVQYSSDRFGRLGGRLEHHQFDKGVADWRARRANYARLEAEEGIRQPLRFASLASRDPLVRRTMLKALFYRLPARWLFAFLYNLFIKFAFLDGRAGMRYLLLETRSQRDAVRQSGREAG